MAASTMKLRELGRTFVASPPLSQSRPRNVRLTAGGRALVVFALLLFGLSIGTGIMMSREAGRQAERRRALVTDGVFVTGDVTRLWENNGDNRRRVQYRFVVDGREYESDTRVSEARRRTLEVGSPIPVRYVPADPRMHDLGGTPRGGMPVWVPFVVAVAIAVAGVLCLLTVDRQRRLLSDGRAAPAIVTAHTHHKSSHGSHRTLTFEFPLLSGVIATATRGTSRKPAPIGSVICILYDPDRPSRNMVYPLSLVRPVR